MDKYNEVLPGGIEVKRTDEFHQFFDGTEKMCEQPVDAVTDKSGKMKI